MSKPRLAYAQRLWCSFCGKRTGEVEKLIAGPTVFICDECVELCHDIVTGEAEMEAARPPFTTAQEERAAEITREIVVDMLKGSDEPIRDAIDATRQERPDAR